MKSYSLVCGMCVLVIFGHNCASAPHPKYVLGDARKPIYMASFAPFLHICDNIAVTATPPKDVEKKVGIRFVGGRDLSAKMVAEFEHCLWARLVATKNRVQEVDGNIMIKFGKEFFRDRRYEDLAKKQTDDSEELVYFEYTATISIVYFASFIDDQRLEFKIQNRQYFFLEDSHQYMPRAVLGQLIEDIAVYFETNRKRAWGSPPKPRGY